MTLRAVSFDLWDTLVVDNSDEDERSARGLPTKSEARRRLVHGVVNAAGSVPRERVDEVVAQVEAMFTEAWRDEHVTWTVEQRLRRVLEELDCGISDNAFESLVRGWETMESEIPPVPVPGVAACLGELAARYRLVVVSDAIITPGRELRAILQNHGLMDHFSAFAFSDEVGRSKPHGSVFEHAAQAVETSPHEMVHVGDREHTDVQGAGALGMKTVLFVGAREDDAAGTTADAVCSDLRELPGIIEALDAGG